MSNFNSNKKGIVFNIQHYSIHDGPGIRTAVFLKGCPLRCRWCANPESQQKKIELGWTKNDCIGCGGCLTLLGNYGCKYIDDKIIWSTDIIPDPNRVKRACPSTALHAIGEEKTVDEIIKAVEKDKVFYSNSGGGLTISGGEPLMQSDFTLALLKAAKARQINTAMETSAFGDTDVFVEIAGQLDYLFTDIKCFNDELHKKNTGVSNKLILKNIKAVRGAYPDLKICIRTPVIPNVNDSESEISKISRFVKSLGGNTEYELLKYHKLGIPKYESLHRDYPMGNLELSDEIFEELKRLANNIISDN
ncbi:MAG: glycyl-radical enzyme activating protein [Eubacterium sp.]